MAIQINGCTVIDNSRNFCNAANINSTAVCTTTLFATNYCGPGASTLGGESYVCAIACTNLTAGDPVATCCTVGVGSVCGDPAYCCFIRTCCDSVGATATNDAVAVKFGCSDCCFATVQFLSPFALGCCITGSPGPNICCDGCIHVRAHCVTATGSQLSSSSVCNFELCWACICNGCNCGVFMFTCAVDQLRFKMIAVPSCSGTIADIILCRFRCFFSCGNGTGCFCCFETDNIRLCYCTSTCTISVVCFCCNTSTTLCCGRTHFITPDNQYFLTVQGCLGTCLSCASNDWSVNVKLRCDTDCYLSYPAATVVAGCPFKAIFPATCTSLDDNTGRVSPELISPFTYGCDGWLPMWANVATNKSNPYCICSEQRLWAIKPVGNNCVCMSCNICNPCGSTCIPFFFRSDCQLCTTQTSTSASVVRSWDQGDGVKRLMFENEVCCSDIPCLGYRLLCFCINNTGNLTYLGLSDSGYCNSCCASCSYRQYRRICYDSGAGSPGGVVGGLACRNCSTTFSLAKYFVTAPLCSANACYYFSGTEHGLYGCSAGGACNFWGGSSLGAPNYADDHIAVVRSFRYAFANTCPEAFTLSSSSFRPITQVSQTHCSVKCICICSCCPKGYNYQPQLFQGNTVVVSAGNGHACPGRLLTGAGSCPAATYIIVYTNNYCNNICCFMGIAQNTVSAGGIACVAVPGMVDRSNVVSNFFPTCSVVSSMICLGATCGCTTCISSATCTLLGLGFGGNFTHYSGHFVTLKRYCDCRSGNLTYISTTKF